MSIVNDFELAWQPFADRLNAYPAEKAMKDQTVSPEEMNSFYRRTAAMWEDGARVQSGFIRKWSAASPGFEKAFRRVLEDFSFREGAAPERPSPFLYAVCSLVITALGGAVGALLPPTSFLKMRLGSAFTIILAAVLFSLVGGGVARSLYEKAVSQASRTVADSYRAQVEELHRRLLELCRGL